MEDFQDNLLERMQNRFFSFKWPGKPGKNDETTKQQHNHVLDNPLLASIQNLHLDIREKINQYFWTFSVEKINTILHGIPFFIPEEESCENSFKLKQNVL